MFTIGFVVGFLGVEVATAASGVGMAIIGLVMSEGRKRRISLETRYYLILAEIAAGGAEMPDFVTDEDREFIHAAEERASYDLFINWTPEELTKGGPFLWSHRELTIYLMAWRANMEMFIKVNEKESPAVVAMLRQVITVVGQLLEVGVEGNEEMAADLVEAVQSARKRALDMGLDTEEAVEA
jgi:hypothetical protein